MIDMIEWTNCDNGSYETKNGLIAIFDWSYPVSEDQIKPIFVVVLRCGFGYIDNVSFLQRPIYRRRYEDEDVTLVGEYRSLVEAKDAAEFLIKAVSGEISPLAD